MKVDINTTKTPQLISRAFLILTGTAFIAVVGMAITALSR